MELRHQLQKAGFTTVWFGQIGSKDVASVRRFKYDNPETYRVLALYFDVEIRTVLATENVTPSKKLLREMTVDDAVGEWYQFGLDYRLRKVHSDWDLSKKSDVYWINDMTIEEHVEVLNRLETWYKGHDFDPDEYIRRYRAILQELRNPRSPDDLYG